MAVQFFGQFLLENRVVTSNQLLEALQIQEKTNVPLGKLALEHHLLTEQNIKDISKKQLSEDVLFGNAAVELSFLNKDQLDHLLELQSKRKRYLGDVLVELGYMKSDEAMKYLGAFAKQNKEQEAKIFEVINTRHEKSVISTSLQMLNKIFYRTMGLQFKVDEVVADFDRKADQFIIMQQLYGDKNYYFGIALKDELFKDFAALLAKEQKVTYVVAAEAIEELIKVITKNIAYKFSMEEISVDLETPRVIFRDDMLYDSGKYVGINVYVNNLTQGDGQEQPLLVDDFRIDFVFMEDAEGSLDEIDLDSLMNE